MVIGCKYCCKVLPAAECKHVGCKLFLGPSLHQLYTTLSLTLPQSAPLQQNVQTYIMALILLFLYIAMTEKELQSVLVIWIWKYCTNVILYNTVIIKNAVLSSVLSMWQAICDNGDFRFLLLLAVNFWAFQSLSVNPLTHWMQLEFKNLIEPWWLKNTYPLFQFIFDMIILFFPLGKCYMVCVQCYQNVSKVNWSKKYLCIVKWDKLVLTWFMSPCMRGLSHYPIHVWFYLFC